jgi:acetyltransferase
MIIPATGVALDACRHGRPPSPAAQRFAVHELAPSSNATPALTRSGQHALWLRGIHALDQPALERLFARLTPTEIRRRFLHSLRELPPGTPLRLCAPDGATEQAWVIASTAHPGHGELHGVGRMFLDAACASAEFALLVERAEAGQGYGRLLLQTLMQAARHEGMHELWSHVAHDNAAMLHLARAHGGALARVAGDPGVVRVRIAL